MWRVIYNKLTGKFTAEMFLFLCAEWLAFSSFNKCFGNLVITGCNSFTVLNYWWLCRTARIWWKRISLVIKSQNVCVRLLLMGNVFRDGRRRGRGIWVFIGCSAMRWWSLMCAIQRLALSHTQVVWKHTQTHRNTHKLTWLLPAGTDTWIDVLSKPLISPSVTAEVNPI